MRHILARHYVPYVLLSILLVLLIFRCPIHDFISSIIGSPQKKDKRELALYYLAKREKKNEDKGFYMYCAYYHCIVYTLLIYLTMTLPNDRAAHSTYCNCKDCCIQFVDHSKMTHEAFRKAVLRRGYYMFGGDIHKTWTGHDSPPVLTPEEESQIPVDSPLRSRSPIF